MGRTGWSGSSQSNYNLAFNPPRGSINFQQFGTADDIDTSDPPVHVWNGFDIDGQNLYTFSVTAAIDTISSSSAADTQVIVIIGLDADRFWNTQIVILNGQTKVPLGTSLIRVNRIINAGTVDVAGIVRLYEDTPIVTGVPTDKTKVRAIINGNDNISQQAIFSCPLNLRCFLLDTYNNIGKAAGASGKQADVNTRFTPLGTVSVSSGSFTTNSEGEGKIEFISQVPVELPAGGDLLWQVNDVSANGTRVNAGFNFFLQP